jgi:hypothetical protein
MQGVKLSPEAGAELVAALTRTTATLDIHPVDAGGVLEVHLSGATLPSPGATRSMLEKVALGREALEHTGAVDPADYDAHRRVQHQTDHPRRPDADRCDDGAHHVRLGDSDQ